MATKKFKCKVCGYIHEGKAAPETCPVCAAPASAFVEIEDAKKKFFADPTIDLCYPTPAGYLTIWFQLA